MHSNQEKQLKASMDPGLEKGWISAGVILLEVTNPISFNRNGSTHKQGLWHGALLSRSGGHNSTSNLDHTEKPSQDAKHSATVSVFCDALLNSCQTESGGVVQGFRRKTHGILMVKVSKRSAVFPEIAGTHHA